MYEKQLCSILLAGTGVRKNSSVACGSSPVKIYYFDCPKRFINRINEVMILIKYRYFIEKKKHKHHL